MLRALQWIKKDPPKDCTICTDSLSLHQSLAKNDWRDPDPWLKQIKNLIWELDCQIHVLWIPSHCGIRGNERADILAEGGTRLGQEETPVTIRRDRSRSPRERQQGPEYSGDESADGPTLEFACYQRQHGFLDRQTENRNFIPVFHKHL